MLSPAAFNAFLKTLEEPPAYAKFILATTEKHKIIPTILSRCQVFDFKRIGSGDIVNYLKSIANQEGISYEEESLHIIARKAEGGLRDALSLFDQLVSFTQGNLTTQLVGESLNLLDSEYYFRLVDCFRQGDLSGALLLYQEVIGCHRPRHAQADGSERRCQGAFRTAGGYLRFAVAAALARPVERLRVPLQGGW